MLLMGGLMALLCASSSRPFAKVPVVGEWLFPRPGRDDAGGTALLTLHGTIMTFFVVIPLLTGAFGNYLILLMIGAPDMAFPRMNALAFWLMIPGSCLAMSALSPGGGAGAGWTSYAPLSTVGEYALGASGQTRRLLALTFAGFARASSARSTTW